MSNTKTIARNTGWFGVENILSSVVGLVSSIAIARALGPSKLGYIIYVMWIANVVSSLGSLGIPATTRKYMAEFIGMGDSGTARYIYFRTLLLQIGMATLATGGILLWVLSDANAEYKLASVLIVLSIWPSMVNSISAMANTATEELSRNLPASVISTLTYFMLIAATLVLKWGVLGVGLAFFSMRAVDFLVRFFPALNRVLAWDTAHVQPVGLSKRMMTFAWQSVASMIVALIVWNRSEVILLKYLCSDIRQIAYYSLAFSMAEQLLLSATVFGAAASATIFVQIGRDQSKLPALTASSFRYLALTSIPLHFIAAALAVPALLLFYGNQYRGAVMVVMLAPLLCLPKAFIGPVQSLLQSAERQSFVILATVLAGSVDIGVAWYSDSGARRGRCLHRQWRCAGYGRRNYVGHQHTSLQGATTLAAGCENHDHQHVGGADRICDCNTDGPGVGHFVWWMRCSDRSIQFVLRDARVGAGGSKPVQDPDRHDANVNCQAGQYCPFDVGPPGNRRSNSNQRLRGDNDASTFMDLFRPIRSRFAAIIAFW